MTPNKNDTYTVYGIDTCPYCQGAKSLVQDLKEAKYHDITGMRATIRPSMIARGLIPATYTTVPLVFKRGVFIGGLTEMKADLHVE